MGGFIERFKKELNHALIERERLKAERKADQERRLLEERRRQEEKAEREALIERNWKAVKQEVLEKFLEINSQISGGRGLIKPWAKQIFSDSELVTNVWQDETDRSAYKSVKFRSYGERASLAIPNIGTIIASRRLKRAQRLPKAYEAHGLEKEIVDPSPVVWISFSNQKRLIHLGGSPEKIKQALEDNLIEVLIEGLRETSLGQNPQTPFA